MAKLVNAVCVNVSELRKDFDLACLRMNIARKDYLHSIGLNANAFDVMRRSYVNKVGKSGLKPCDENEFVGIVNKFRYEHICKQANLDPEKYLVKEETKEKNVVSDADAEDIKNIGRVLLDIRCLLKEILEQIK